MKHKQKHKKLKTKKKKKITNKSDHNWPSSGGEDIRPAWSVNLANEVEARDFDDDIGHEWH